MVDVNRLGYGERLLYRVLTEEVFIDDVEILANHRPDWFRNPATNCRMEIDFFMPSLGVGIELQGPHHYEDFGQIERDNVKREIMKSRGLIFIELSLAQIQPTKLKSKFLTLKKRHGLRVSLHGHRKEPNDLYRECAAYGRSFCQKGQTASPVVEAHKILHENGAFIVKPRGRREYIETAKVDAVALSFGSYLRK